MIECGPNFLCIGAAKAGTTWLWENLDRHPQVWVPPLKELHWFDVRHPPRALGGQPDFVHRRGLRRYTLLYRRPTLRKALWLLNFYSALDRGGDYYALFDRRLAPFLGEMTPAYAILDRDVVESLHRQMPADCRIIFIMREPVDRLWSALRMHCRHNDVRLSSLSEAQLEELSKLPQHELRSNYTRTLENWTVFGERLGLFFYEDMHSDPAGFLRNVLDFIGADSTWRSPLLHHVSNAGESSRPPPPQLLDKWRAQYAGMVSQIRALTGRVPAAWEYA